MNIKVFQRNKRILTRIVILSLFLIAIFTMSINKLNASGLDIKDLEDNMLSNPNLHYGNEDTTIPNWSIRATNNIGSGQGDIRNISTNIVDGKRETEGIEGFHVSAENDETNYTSYVKKDADENAFIVIFQTHSNLDPNKTYIFRAEVLGNTKITMNIYEGESISEPTPIAEDIFTMTSTKQVIEVEFKPSELTEDNKKVTLSIRHYSNKNDESYLNIQGLGFIEKENYFKQQYKYLIESYLIDEQIELNDDI